jgi:hypothetical protein
MLEIDPQSDVAFVVTECREGEEGARPPFQPPRRRSLHERDAMALQKIVAAELALEPNARIEVSEWVAYDPQRAPHTTVVVVMDRTRQLSFSLAMAVAKIGPHDIRGAVHKHLSAYVVPRGVTSVSSIEAP